MKISIYILIIIPILTFGQNKRTKRFESYLYSDGKFYYRLDLHNDSSFKYEHSFKLGSTSSKGNWKINNDTLLLYNYKTPWTISKVDEKFIDTLNNRILIEIKVGDTLKFRGDYNSHIYIDGKPTSVKFDFSKGIYKVTNFNVWINGYCKEKKRTNEKGIVIFDTDSIFKISIDYNDYLVRNNRNNYFVITIQNFPVLTSPSILKWTKWIIKNDEIIPLECGKLLNYINLKKTNTSLLTK